MVVGGVPKLEKLFRDLRTFRRDLHQYPELSWQEKRTSERIARFLESRQIVHRPVVGTGIVAELPGTRALPAVGLRADMDALPLQEETQLSFASRNPGVMHACGHDGHTTIVLGAAALLASEPPLPAPVRILFQPAEEVAAGAKAMVEAGLLRNVDCIFGGHIDCQYPVGTVVIQEGAVNASADDFSIRIQGKGGHAARPHQGLDAVVVASQLVLALQSIVSRELDPGVPGVLTVGRFRAGTARNVLAHEAILEGTIRTLDPQVRDQIVNSLRRTVSSVAAAFGATAVLKVNQCAPPVINPPDLSELAREAALEAVGAGGIRPLQGTNMGGEDFAYYLQEIPGCFVRFGAGREGVKNYPAHSSRFDFNEDVLRTGALFFDRLVRLAAQRVAAKAPGRSKRRARQLSSKPVGQATPTPPNPQ